MKYRISLIDDEGEESGAHEFRTRAALRQHLLMNPDLNEIGSRAKYLAAQKGFGEEDSQQMSVCRIALMHQELSELLEALRQPEQPSTKVPSISLEEEELADLIIRATQYAAIRGFDLDTAVRLKHEYNKSRPFKHGKNF